MAADTYSARLGLIEQGTGNNNNSWGTTFNASFTDLLDRHLCGIDTHAVTGGTLNLAGGTLPPAGASPVAAHIQSFTGTLTADQNVTWPGLSGRWTIFNNTTGAFSLLLSIAGMVSPIQIPQGKFVEIVSDGTTLYRKDRDQVGRAIFHAGSTVPSGALEMDGSSLLRSQYPDLFGAIGTTYGTVDILHFTLPNTNDTGRFLRSRSGSITLGTAQSNQNAAHTHTASSSSVTGTTDSQGAHSHTANVTDPTHAHTMQTYNNSGSPLTGVGTSGAFQTSTTSSNATGISVSIVSAGAHTHNVTGTAAAQVIASSGGTEARPEAIAMIACILY